MTITIPDDLLILNYARQTAKQMFAAAHTLYPDNLHARQSFYSHGIFNLTVVPITEIFFGMNPGDLTPAFAETIHLYHHSLAHYAINTYRLMEIQLVDPGRAQTAEHALHQLEEMMNTIHWPLPDTQQKLIDEIKQVAPTLALSYHNGIFSMIARTNTRRTVGRIQHDVARYTVCKFASLDIREFPPEMYGRLVHDVATYVEGELLRFDPNFQTISFEPRP